MKATRVDVTAQKAVLRALHTLTFPGDEQPIWRAEGRAWIVYDDGEPVAFLYAEPLACGSWYFSRVGVMPSARGHGLQRQLMRCMERALRRAGVKVLVSTTYQNPASANNFVREQWMTYLPAYAWGHHDTIYWRKDFK